MGEYEAVLALDLGISRITAASAGHAQSEDVETDSYVLGHRGGSTAALAFVADDGEILFGDVAEQRGFSQPDNLIRGFTAGIGDEIPLMAGGTALPAAELTARLTRWAAARASEPHPAIAITHPAAWTSHRIDALRTALSGAGFEDVRFMTAAEAAIRHHDAMLRDAGAPPLPVNAVVAVYDLGGEGFEATIVRKDAEAEFRILGEPVAIADAAGALFDDLLLEHALRTSGADDAASAVDDAAARVAFARLRRACVSAKESLSFDADAAIPITLPGRSGSVRITRSELETMIDPALERTLDAVEHALDDAKVNPDQLEHVLLLGGSSRIPLVAQRLSERIDRPIVSAPDAAAAFGAARAALLEGQASAELAAPPAADPESVPATAVTQSDGSLRPSRKRRLIPLFATASVRSASPAIVTIAAVLAAVGVATSTAGAAILRDVTAEDAPAANTVPETVNDPTASDPFAPLFSGTGTLTPPDDVAPQASLPAPAPILVKDEAPAPGPRSVVRETLSAEKAPRASAPKPPRQRGPVVENAAAPVSDPRPPGSTPKPTPRPTPSPTSQPVPDPGPVDPGPTTPPADPTPTTPPADPTPTTPPADPTPTTPPADPTPSDPPADPTPTVPPPSDPTPPPPSEEPSPPPPSVEPI